MGNLKYSAPKKKMKKRISVDGLNYTYSMSRSTRAKAEKVAANLRKEGWLVRIKEGRNREGKKTFRIYKRRK